MSPIPYWLQFPPVPVVIPIFGELALQLLDRESIPPVGRRLVMLFIFLNLLAFFYSSQAVQTMKALIDWRARYFP
jgi:hypothetical protein